MVRLEYIETIKYQAGMPRAMFLLADMEAAAGRQIVVFGAGLEAFPINQFLMEKDIP